MLENYKDCLLYDKIILKSQQVFRSDHHDVYTVEIMVMKYKDLVLNDKNRIKETNGIFKTRVTKCMLNRLIRFCKSEMFMVMKYKDFLPNRIEYIKKTDRIFKAINTKCTMNRSILFRESNFRRGHRR